ncbi:MAG: hypothetical protein P1U58_09795 [Verrucomicrobiales bacterium]|nr:hypothetical protein [Verrucomicrobiales bacterium]
MRIKVELLEKKVESPDGSIRARCPACAAEGGDSKGEHLMVFANGKFGCAVHPGDREHRKRIFALVGVGQRRPAPYYPRVRLTVKPKPGWKD